MFIPRKTESNPQWTDQDGIKIYTISVNDNAVDQSRFSGRLNAVKQSKALPWAETATFTIFHEGAGFLYLILAWWGNDNELFTSISVLTEEGWVEDPGRFSFCVYDLEVFWAERNIYIDTLYCATPDIQKYREQRMGVGE